MIPPKPETPSPNPAEDTFVASLTASQFTLQAFIRSLLTEKSPTDDILQETNLVLWKKRADFTPGTSFKAWAFQVARYQTLAFLKKDKKRPVPWADDELFEKLAAESAEIAHQFDERRAALSHCLDKLKPLEKKLITARYETEQPVTALAEKLRRPAGSLRVSLYRVRAALRRCIEARLALNS